MSLPDTNGCILCLAMLAGGAAHAETAPPNPIKHIIIIMQENRSFDSYFGAFPGANGPPSGTCVPIAPSKAGTRCVAPFHDPLDVQIGADHRAADAQADIDDGIKTAKMDGFIQQETIAQQSAAGAAAIAQGKVPFTTGSTLPLTHDVMGYHTDAEIPNYWAYAHHFVLQDRMFESVRGWSGDAHDYLVSEWAASCTNQLDASTCSSAPNIAQPGGKTTYPWVNLFQLMDVNKVGWKYYLGEGDEPDCEDSEMTCAPEQQSATIPNYWNPAPLFAWVKQQGKAYLAMHNPPVDQFLLDIKNRTLPKVSWIIPSRRYSEHPLSGVTVGMNYVTSLVNAVMQSPYWYESAIYITWDDWGGFYDHVPPPNADFNSTSTPVEGYGLRVPGLMLSAYARPGYIDHAIYSFDSYATLIENLFMQGARLDPSALGNPDHRPTIRDTLKMVTEQDGTKQPVGDLLSEFDFTAAPARPVILETHTPSGLLLTCSGSTKVSNTVNCSTAGPLTISWDAITGDNTSDTFTYHVVRDGVHLANCIVTTNSCTDSPGTGQHFYRAYSVGARGEATHLSAAALAIVK